MESTFLITMETVYHWQSKHHEKVSLTWLRIGSSHFPSSHHIPTSLVVGYDLGISPNHFDIVSGSLFVIHSFNITRTLVLRRFHDMIGKGVEMP